MRAVVSTVSSPPKNTSNYLVKITQLTLNKKKHRFLNSFSFTDEAKHEINSTSFDVTNLYPSVPINETIAVFIEILTISIDDLRKRVKVTLTDIH